ncbi:class I adenylate-forming enzyme family protein [Actinokineospora bangkokensis]|uniref:AMP-dependent synthetase n=1 Tax=Actinokineospora bangkokensis TaxID=1193682 RepID=A0A1Q9LQX6_9PSEU|nr:AMP-binding protein [Actinokineospora bangkokensis]OLR94420.1 AMP-dependent synthetase [Actinokineospora bangkokensis]
MHFALLPEERRRTAPDAPALADDGHPAVSNDDFATMVGAAADRLRDAGVRAGGVVAVKLTNRVELVVAMFAAWRLGAALTPVNPALTAAETAYQLTDSGAAVLVTDHLDDAPADGPVVVPVDQLTTGTPGGSTEAVAAEDEDIALIIYTSGTTGRPKGVLLTHANLDAMTESSLLATGIGADDHCLLILPLFHVNGIVVSVLTPLRAGGRTTIVGKFSARSFFTSVERARPTYFSGVPAIFAMLANLPDDQMPDTSSLRFVVCGAAPMPAPLISAVEKRYGVTLVEGYGLSEATCGSTLNPVRGTRKPGTVGLPMPGQRVAVMAEDGTLLPPGETGEVVVSGPTVMKGYLNRPEATDEALRGGWLHTGDVGRFDEDGYLVLVDRIKDMIIRGGENIYPKEIETVLHEHPEVFEAAVIGVPDPVLGEVPVAVVSLRGAATTTAEELTDFLRERLAAYKVPSRVDLVAEVPKNQVGKIDKPALRARAAPITA